MDFRRVSTRLMNDQCHTDLSNILVPHPTDLLNIRRALRHILQRISGDGQFVFLALRYLNINTFVHRDSSNNLLPQEISVTMSHQPMPSLGIKFSFTGSPQVTYRISTSCKPVSEFFSILTLMGKCA